MEDSPRPQINASKLRVGGEIVGALFTIGTMLIFLIGIPVLRYVFPVAILLGCLVALVLHFVNHKNPGAPWLIAATERKADLKPRDVPDKTPGNSPKIVLVPLTARS